MNKEREKLSAAIEKTLKKLPKEPGVYQYFDAEGKLLYIGKAKNLKNRVKSYFQNSAHQGLRTKKLVSKIEKIEWIAVESEAEALALEANMIHEYNPPFNVLLRDDKHFLYLHITKDPFPRVVFTRQMKKRNGTYFGPYVKASSIRKTIDFLREILAFRTCRVEISPKGHTIKNPENRKIPCLDYQIHHCSGPCDGKITQEEYANDIKELISFLRGNTRILQKKVQKKMIHAAENKDFERAARFRDIIISMEGVQMKQVASIAEDFSADIIGFVHGKTKSFACMFFVRHGKILRRENIHMKNEGDEQETFFAFLREFLSASAEIPSLIIIPPLIEKEDIKAWEVFASSLAGKNIEIRLPQKGKKKQLLELAQKNAAVQAANSKARFEEEDVLQKLQNALSLPRRPKRIECYDISHLGGTHTVASQVVFVDGEPEKKEYRKYKIRTVENGKPDDFASMKEVLERRLSRLLHTNTELEMREITTKKEKKEREKVLKKNGNLWIQEREKTYAFEVCSDAMHRVKKNVGNGHNHSKVVGYLSETHQKKILEIGNIFVFPEYEDRFGESEILRTYLKNTKEKTIRICVGEKDVKRHLYLKKLGFLREKKPPKAFIKAEEKKKVIFKHIHNTRTPSQIPDLLVIDGGKGQLSMAVKALKKLKLFEKIPVCSLAKREEKVFVPGKKQPLNISKKSEENELLQRLRDEAHRFAITFNRQLRKNAETKSALDEINGIGEKTKKILLKEFGSVQKILEAKDEELLKFISKKVVENIRGN